MTNGEVKIGMNSTFKTWQVDGQDDLVAQGLDTMTIIAGNDITLTTAQEPKSLTIDYDTTNIDTSFNLKSNINNANFTGTS